MNILDKPLAAMHTASAKARQEMMDNIPVHEKVMQGVYSTYAEALQEIRNKDIDIQKNFSERYGIDMKEIFAEYYNSDGGTSSSGGDEPTGEGEGQPEDSGDDDLLG